MTRVTFSPGQGNFQAKFKSATENVTLKNQVSAGSRLDTLSDVNTQSQPDNSILVYDSASDTFVQQALSSIAAANTSVASVSVSGDIATFTRQDGSTFTMNLSNISANNIAVSAVNTNSNFKVPFTTTTSDGSTDVRLQIESQSSQFVYNPNSGTLSAPALSTTSLEVSDTATISTLVLTNVLGTQYGGTGLNSVTNNGVLVGKSSSALNYISGTSGEVFQVASNGTPTFSDVDGGTY